MNWVVCVYSKSPTDVEAAHEILSVHNGIKSVLELMRNIENHSLSSQCNI